MLIACKYEENVRSRSQRLCLHPQIRLTTTKMILQRVGNPESLELQHWQADLNSGGIQGRLRWCTLLSTTLWPSISIEESSPLPIGIGQAVGEVAASLLISLKIWTPACTEGSVVPNLTFFTLDTPWLI